MYDLLREIIQERFDNGLHTKFGIKSGNKYWTGKTFSANKSEMIRFPSAKAATQAVTYMKKYKNVKQAEIFEIK